MGNIEILIIYRGFCMRKVVSVVLMMIIGVMALTGCAITKPETSHLVTLSDDGKKIVADLKQSTSEGYEWQYSIEGNNLQESASDFTNNIFSDTYGSKYDFVAADTGQDTLFLILTKDGDLDNAKVFYYTVSIDVARNIKIEKEGSYLLPSNLKLYQKLTGK